MNAHDRRRWFIALGVLAVPIWVGGVLLARWLGWSDFTGSMVAVVCYFALSVGVLTAADEDGSS